MSESDERPDWSKSIGEKMAQQQDENRRLLKEFPWPYNIEDGASVENEAIRLWQENQRLRGALKEIRDADLNGTWLTTPELWMQALAATALADLDPSQEENPDGNE